jgi:Tfp pilus assembly protein FimT
MKHKSESGFSVIELTVISAIVIVIAAIAIPNVVAARRSYTLLIGAEGLAQQLNRCRQEAVRVNDTMQIQVTATTTQIDLSRDGAFAGADGAVYLIENVTIGSMAPADGVVTFNSRGELPVLAPSGSSTVSASGYKRVVTIEPRGAVIVGPEIPV